METMADPNVVDLVPSDCGPSPMPLGKASDPLRVALLAGTLEHGGAEKQLVYTARALQDAGVHVRVYTLGESEFYEAALRETGLDPVGVGRLRNPAGRVLTFARALRQFRPHIVQAGTFYVNLYVALASRLCGALAIGAIRGDVALELQNTGRWGPFLLRVPDALVANSHAAQRAVVRLGLSPEKIHVVPNVIETALFDRAYEARQAAAPPGQASVILVAQLIQAKRVDRFLSALVVARRSAPGLTGAVIGDGAERVSLEQDARRLGLVPNGIEFRGLMDDIPRVMADADVLALTSDHEGLPNVIMEAMAARLPVVTTPAGDAAALVEHGVTGFVVPFDGAVEQLAERLIQLARRPSLRHQMGEAGYARVTAGYDRTALIDRLVAVYRTAALRRGHGRVLERLPRVRSVRAALAPLGVALP